MDGRSIPSTARCFAVLILQLLSAQALAGTGNWTLVGSPQGGRASSILVDPNDASRLYAGSRQGVFISSDHGAHWTLSLNVPRSESGPVIAVGPGQHGTIYVGGAGSGIWRSMGSGLSW